MHERGRGGKREGGRQLQGKRPRETVGCTITTRHQLQDASTRTLAMHAHKMRCVRRRRHSGGAQWRERSTQTAWHVTVLFCLKGHELYKNKACSEDSCSCGSRRQLTPGQTAFQALALG